MFAASPPSEWLHDLLTQLDMLSMTTAGSRVDGSVLAMVDLPSWSMCWELLFSLALPIYVVIATDMRIVAPVVLACVLVAEWAQWPPLRHMAVFALGVALARSLVDRGRESMRSIVAVPAALCGVVLICQSGLGVLPGVVAQPLAVCGCLLLVAVALARNAVSDALSTAPVRWLGRVSFSLYLTHLPVRRLARAIHPRARRAAPGTADSAVPAGSGGVPPSRGAPGDHAIEKAGEINIPLASSRQGEYGGFTTRAHLRRPWNMRL